MYYNLNLLFYFLRSSFISICLTIFCLICLTIFCLITGFKLKTIFRNFRIIQFSYFKSFYLIPILYLNLFTLVVSFFIGKKRFKPQVSLGDFLKLEDLKKTGGVILTAHYGDWELTASYLIQKIGLKLKGVAHPFKSSFWQSIILNQRLKNGGSVIDNKISYESFSYVKQNGVLYFLLDQFNYKGIEVNYFNQKIKLNRLPIKICFKLSKPCYSVFLYKNKIRVFCLYSGKGNRNPKIIYQRYLKFLTIVIKKQPYQWVGVFHNLFK